MRILAIETSCDETAVAVVEKTDAGWVRVLGEAVASSEEVHVGTGGIVPEVAAREQMRAMLPVLRTAVEKVIINSKFEIRNSKQVQITNAQISRWVKKNVDAVAVTVGPGLIGSLLVGVETAKTLALVWDKPLIPVNHLVGHLYGAWVETSSDTVAQRQGGKETRWQRDAVVRWQDGAEVGWHGDKAEQRQDGAEVGWHGGTDNRNPPSFPVVGLVVSGGHTDLVLMEGHHKIRWLGGTRDDAAGECLDKCARVLGLPYPGGPAISAAAENFLNFKHQKSNNGHLPTIDDQFKLPRPLLSEDTYDFSFSGLKIAVQRGVDKAQGGNRTTETERVVKGTEAMAGLAWELQEAVVEVLVEKLMRAVQEYEPKSVVVAGGVAANKRLREEIGNRLRKAGENERLYIPLIKYCTDNAAMVGAAAVFDHSPALKIINVKADPSLDFSDVIN